MATIDDVRAAFERARGRWAGCDWPTSFGTLRLDLEGVSALRAAATALRWRAVAAGEGATTNEDVTLAQVAFCIQLRTPAVWPDGDRSGTPHLAPRPTRRHCAELFALEWEVAACVLAEIESDAELAERAARAAVRYAAKGDWRRALRHARVASSLESSYPAARLWRALEALLGEVAAQAPRQSPPCRESLAAPERGATLTTQKQKRDGAEPTQSRALEALLGAAVLRALGTPNDLRSVQVRRLWDVYYRVNVLTGGEDATAAITHSYFLTTDGAGVILEASPPIVTRY